MKEGRRQVIYTYSVAGDLLASDRIHAVTLLPNGKMISGPTTCNHESVICCEICCVSCGSLRLSAIGKLWSTVTGKVSHARTSSSQYSRVIFLYA